MIKLTRYQWTVFFAAWLGWGFDVFDGLLFNYVAPNAIPTLLGVPIGGDAARAALPYWTGILNSLFLLGWAAGGVLFGPISDRFGRRRVLMITMVLYAVGTASCAFVTEMWQLIAFRLIASLGIGGEWAAGSAMVAEVVPEESRVEAGALLYTSAPFGLFLATFVNSEVAGGWFAHDPASSWRYVLLFGLLPAAVAFVVRWFVKEPERWTAVAKIAAPARLREIFTPALLPRTISALIVTLIALITWWSCNAFIPSVANTLAGAEAVARGLDAVATGALKQEWIKIATNAFNFGGLLGTLLTIPFAKRLGRRPMYRVYFAASALSLLATFGLDLPAELRLYLYFFIGLSVFGTFGSFTFYLPELFPTRLRSTGAGFCYNIGRVVAAAGVFAVGAVSAAGKGDPAIVLRALFMIGFVPLIGLLFLRWVVETRGQRMPD
ncbi:MAG TPA: MFS transporter [Steroidobacteraceae bacterium]|nr:MFS transporter [Steroidobacteraceae bacterium]